MTSAVGGKLRPVRRRMQAFAYGSSIAALALAIPLALSGGGKALAADDEKDAGSTLSEVVVTAEFRQQNLQKSPIAITAINSEMLAQRSITNSLDVTQAAPNILMRQGSSGAGSSNQAFIRGIGQADFLFAYSPRISFYIDDVYFSTVYGSVFDLVDVDSVEIRRGPQGTLSGRNAVGGAISIRSKKPRGDGSGYLEATGGSLDRLAIKGAIDMPIVPEKLMVRLSGYQNRNDGWVDLVNFACANPQFAYRLPKKGTNTKDGCDVGTLGGNDTWAVRGQVRWVLNDKIENNLAVDYLSQHNGSSPDVLTAPVQVDTFNRNGQAPPGSLTTPNGLGVWLGNVGGPDYGIPLTANCLTGITQFSGTPAGFDFRPRQYCQPSGAFLGALYPNNPYVSYASFGNPGLNGIHDSSGVSDPTYPRNPYYNRNAGFLDPPGDKLKQYGLANTLTAEITEDIRVKSVTAWRGYSGTFAASQSAIALPIQESYQGVSHHQFSEELTFTGELFEKRLEWALGGFYLNTGERNTGRVQFEGFAIAGGPDVQDFLIDDPATLKNRSAFAHANFHLTDQLTLEGGIRFSHEKKTYAFTRQYIFYQGYATPPSVSTVGTDDVEEKWTPRFSLQYQATPDVLLYASYSTGFTAGGINGRPFDARVPSAATNGQGDIFPYGPEDVKAYEVGLKTQLFDRRVRFNTAGFFTKYDNIQVTLLGSLTGRPTTIFYTANGGSAEIKGFEAEVEAHPFAGWLINSSVGYTDFKYTKLATGVAGLTLNSVETNVPKWTVSAGTQYDIDLGDTGTLTPRFDVNWRSTIYFNGNDTVSEITKQKGYAIMNARLTWRAANGDWSVSGAVTNLADKLYYNQKVDGRTGFGTAYGQVGQPREWTVTVRRNF